VSKTIDAAASLAEFAVELTYERIPDEVRESTKRSILDTLGVTMAASTQGEGYRQLIDLLTGSGGTPESTILGFGERVPAWVAAFANAAMARALMYDDYHTFKTHPSATTVTSAIAVAERLGTVSGRDLITAAVVGNEITCRLGLSIPLSVAKGAGWLTTDVFGTFGAAAAAGKLLGLDAERLQNAFGIALFEAAGTREAYSGSSTTGRSTMMQAMSTGFRAKGAVFAALMAQVDITGPADSLEGRTGLFNVYFKGAQDRTVLLGELGERFESRNIGIKPSPGTWHAFTNVDAVRDLMRQHDIAADDIAEIAVLVTPEAYHTFLPLDVKRRPATSQDANHSLPYLISFAAVHGRVTVVAMTPPGYEDPDVRAFAERIIPVVDETLDASDPGPGEAGPGRIRVTLIDGTAHQVDIHEPYGHPRYPISWGDLTDKFRECASYAAEPLEEDTVERIIEIVTRLEDVDDIRDVMGLLA
jgi:2-methylcitrate dehydratase PrpD